MAPITLPSAKLAFEKAANQLKRACTSLERHLPPPQDGEEEVAPPVTPRPRTSSIAGCSICVSELFDLEAGDREGHVCTHREVQEQQVRADKVTTTSSDTATG